MMNISIIICTYNRDKYLYHALRCIALNDFLFSDYEVILINNNSTDNSENECLRFHQDFPEVNFGYFVESNQGLSYARNRGISEANGDVLVFLDDDAFVHPDYLKNLSENLKAHPDFAAFGGKIIPKFESGIAPKWFSKWTYSWVSGIDLGSKTRIFTSSLHPIGANMGIKSCVFHQVGKFDIKLGRVGKNLIGGEEYDLFNRINKSDEKIYYFPNIEVEHIIPESRTTNDYVRQLALANGISERIRTLNISRFQYIKRLFFEVIQWFAAFLLLFRYVLVFESEKGTILLIRRFYVTKGLISNSSSL